MNQGRQRSTLDSPPTPTEHPLECPLCRSPMHLRTSRYGLFYGCSRWPQCDATHGAHPNGEPLGIPADNETKRWRIKAHEAFDRLWNGPGACMSRPDAYRWMIQTLALPAEEAHIARFSREQCQRLIVALEAKDQLDAMNGGPVDQAEISQRRAAKRRQKQKNRRKYHAS